MPHIQFQNIKDREIQKFIDSKLLDFQKIAKCDINKITVRKINSLFFNTKNNELNEPVYVNIDWMPRTVLQEEQVKDLILDYLKSICNKSAIIEIRNINKKNYFTL